MDNTNAPETQPAADPQMSPVMSLVLPAALVLALLAVLIGAAVLAGPHLASLAQSLGHNLLASAPANPMACGNLGGACD